MTKIGVFDSGIGGLSVAQALQTGLPDDDIIFVNDRAHMPYGDKTPEELLGFVVPILNNLVAEGCEIVVIACNTVTTTLLGRLRNKVSVPLIGVEPMVGSAVAGTKTGIIAVCATPATLASKRYDWLKRMFAKDVRILEPDCSRWAYMIEHNTLNKELIAKQINEVCAQGADVIVLGCTHYHWIQKQILAATKGRAVIVQPESSIVRRVKLAKRKLAA